jgi:Phage virion morphogenesis family
MPLRFEFEAEGDKLVSRELLDMGDRALDARPAFRLIADDFREFEAARFDSRGEGTWVPLAPATIREKAERGLDPRVLHATGQLRASLTKKGAKGSYSRIFPSFMLFGSTVPYAKYLQTGTRFMPPRKPLGFTEPQKITVLKRLQRHVVESKS